MRQVEFQRILVALDASADSQAALEAAADLAAELRAELLGLFVEDINLLQMAKLPYAQEVRYMVADMRKVDAPHLEQQLRRQAAEAERQLAKEAKRRNISWSFRVARGAVAAELLGAATDADLLALGRAGQSVIQAVRRLGSTARKAVVQAPHAVLLMQSGIDLDRPVLLVFDGSNESWRALAIALRLARVSGELRILICAEDDSSAERYEAQISDQVEPFIIELTFRRLYQPSPTNLAYLLKLSGVDLLVLGSTDQLPAETIQTMIGELEHPVLVVR
jgi:nucleotide-binding universal stress UspA family protein